MLPGWCCIANRHIGARERRQLIPPHVRFQVPFLGPESQLKSGFACAGLLCPMDYVQVLHQFSFAALNSRWPGTLIGNYCSCNVIQCGKRPGESHEGVGRKKGIEYLLLLRRPCCLASSSCRDRLALGAVKIPDMCVREYYKDRRLALEPLCAR